MKILTFEQQSPEWFAARLGIPTASKFNKIITSKGKPSDSALGYMYTLATERLSGIREQSFSSAATKEGIRREEESRMVYAMLHEIEIEQVGFCLEDGGRWGCSPDGLVGDDGLVECKNPTGKVAVEYLLGNKLPTKYSAQVQGQMFVTERDWVDFVSYFPGIKTLIVRVNRDEVFIKALEKELIKFSDKLDEVCREIERGGNDEIGRAHV